MKPETAYDILLSTKKEITDHLEAIRIVAEKTGMQGTVTLEYSDFTIAEWDSVVAGITDYPKRNHFISVTPHLTVALILS